MIEIIETTDNNLLEVKVIEEATDADIEHIKSVLKKHVVEASDPRLLIILEEITDWTEVVGLWSDLNLDGDEVDDFSRIALVGDASWKGWLTNTIESLVNIELKFFGMPDLLHARKWVQN